MHRWLFKERLDEINSLTMIMRFNLPPPETVSNSGAVSGDRTGHFSNTPSTYGEN